MYDTGMSFNSLLMNNLALFASSVLNAPPKNVPFLIGKHHERWSEMVSKHQKTIIQSARGHGKSLLFSYAYPIWMAARTPNGRGAIFCSNDTQAKKRLRDIRRELETNPKLRPLLPSKRARSGEGWSANRLRLANGHEIEVFGFNSSSRGIHPDWIVLDDVVDDDSMYSASVRLKSIDYFRSAIENMLMGGGELRIIGTAFHAEDLYSDILKDDEYVSDISPALDPETDEALWEELFPYEWLLRRRKSIGNVRFSREYLCRPVSDDSSLFPSNLFENIFMPYALGTPGRQWRESHKIETIVLACDFAISKSVGADYTVLFVFGIDDKGTRWIIDIIRLKGLEFKKQLQAIKVLAKRHGPDIVACEANVFQRIFGDELAAETDLPIVQVHTLKNKHSLSNGVPALALLLENNKVRAPEHTPLVQTWITELQSFTFTSEKGVVSAGKHDDVAMAWFVGESGVQQRTGLDFGSGAEPLDEEEELEYQGMMADLNEPLDPDEVAEWFGSDAPDTSDPDNPTGAPPETFSDPAQLFAPLGSYPDPEPKAPPPPQGIRALLGF